MPNPTVTAVTPNFGGLGGDTVLTLTGTNFTGTTGVTIGGIAATSVAVVSDTSITLKSPAGAAGTASVVVTNASGSNGANTLFFYVASRARDLYVYLSGGRGDARATDEWDGQPPTEEGGVDEEGAAIDDKGLEASEPYRDIFQGGQPLAYGGADANAGSLSVPALSSIIFADPVEVSPPAYSGGQIPGSIVAELSATTSDEVAHLKPRQYSRVATWLIFAGGGATFKFRKNLVLGWGSFPRSE